MRDESLMGGTYHGPSNAPGLTRREYDELQAEDARDRSPYDDIDASDGCDFDDFDDDGDGEED